MLQIRTNRKVIIITCMLYLISLGAGIVFYVALESCIVASGILGFCFFIASRFWIAFGRTILFSEAGITISFLWILKVVTWDRVNKITIYNTGNNIGYKDVSYEGIEFLMCLKLRKYLSPATFCFIFYPFTYVFCTFSDAIMQPDSMHYPVFYPVDRMEAMNKLGLYISLNPG